MKARISQYARNRTFVPLQKYKKPGRCWTRCDKI
jgi:hypothetical protein